MGGAPQPPNVVLLERTTAAASGGQVTSEVQLHHGLNDHQGDLGKVGPYWKGVAGVAVVVYQTFPPHAASDKLP